MRKVLYAWREDSNLPYAIGMSYLRTQVDFCVTARDDCVCFFVLHLSPAVLTISTGIIEQGNLLRPNPNSLWQ